MSFARAGRNLAMIHPFCRRNFFPGNAHVARADQASRRQMGASVTAFRNRIVIFCALYSGRLSSGLREYGTTDAARVARAASAGLGLAEERTSYAVLSTVGVPAATRLRNRRTGVWRSRSCLWCCR